MNRIAEHPRGADSRILRRISVLIHVVRTFIWISGALLLADAPAGSAKEASRRAVEQRETASAEGPERRLLEPGGRTTAVAGRRTAEDLSGEWRVFLPAGFEHRIIIEKVGDRYLLKPAELNFAGLYDVRDDRLMVVEPREPHLKGFEWQIRSPFLLSLSAQSRNTGADYTGAVLWRSSDLQPKRM